MFSPLSKRFPRQLKHHFGKYLGIFALLCVCIALLAGFLTAASSIEKLFNDMPQKYQIEDGRLTSANALTQQQLDCAEDYDLRIYESFSKDIDFDIPNTDAYATMRLYENRTTINFPALSEGVLPSHDNQIAINRNFASNRGVVLGDTITLAGYEYEVCGIVTLPDYAAQFQDNSDFVMDALTFCTALVTKDGFDRIDDASTSYTYSFTFNDKQMSTAERLDAEAELVTALGDEGVILSDLTDKDVNQGITYAGNDVSHDQKMFEVVLFLLIAIMAFIFVVLTGATIEEESAVIGTLMASGYRKGEILRHYLFLPFVVGLAAAALGNVLGYTILSDPMRGLYYNSYSFPPYEASFSWRIFAMTTVIPLILLWGITAIGLARKLRCTPLQFLRHEVQHTSKRSGFKLPSGWGYVARFRARVFMRNMPHFLTMLCGILLSTMLLLFGLAMMPTVQNYANSLADTVPAQHIYTLKAPLEIDGTQEQRDEYAALKQLRDEGLTTESDVDDVLSGSRSIDMPIADFVELAQRVAKIDENANPVNVQENSAEAITQAEKVAVGKLEVPHKFGSESEQVTIYGIEPDSAYFDADVSDGKIVAGTGLSEKCQATIGTTVSAYDKYENRVHDLTIDDVYGPREDTNIYVSFETFNDLYGYDANYFNAYATDMTLNIDSEYLSGDITPEGMQKLADQMQDSMGDFIGLLQVLSIFVFFVIMYLLTKTVIERNSRQIAYLKVFGYTDKEISKLYVRTITLTVLVSLIISLPIVLVFLGWFCELMFMDYSGNFVLNFPQYLMLLEVAIGFATYLLVAALHMQHIKKVPLAMALKIQE